MPLFGPPNVEKLKAKRSVDGLIKALGYKKDSEDYRHRGVRRAAAEALGYLSPKEARAKKGEIRERLAALRIGSFGEGRAIAKQRIMETTKV